VIGRRTQYPLATDQKWASLRSKKSKTTLSSIGCALSFACSPGWWHADHDYQPVLMTCAKGSREIEKAETMKVDPKSIMTGSRWHTVKGVADRLDVSERSVRRWITLGLIRPHRFGRAVRISEEDLVAFERQARG
jgi:excisionase family DNA binding protein